MLTSNHLKLIGKQITLYCERVNAEMDCTIDDVRVVWGKLQITIQGGKWFEPTRAELESVRELD